MPKRKLDYMINSPYKKRKLSGEFIYKPKGFFGESLIKCLIDKCVNPKCKSSGYFGMSLKK